MKRLVMAVVVALSVVGCGDTNVLGGGTVPSLLPTKGDLSTGGNTVRSGKMSVDPNASCPDGHGPTGLQASSNRDAVVAYISWDAVLGVQDYSYEVERYLPTNVYQLVHASSIDLTHEDVRTGQGHFRVRVRTRVCDSQFSPWSEWVRFTVGEDSNAPDPIVVVVPPVEVPPVVVPPVVTPPVVIPPVVIPPVVVPPVVVPPVVIPPVVPPVVVPPVDDGNNGHGNDGDHVDDSNPGNGGNGGNTPPAGGGNGNSCSIHTSGKPVTPPPSGNGNGGGNTPSVPDGDHNSDLHPDCGVGNTH